MNGRLVLAALLAVWATRPSFAGDGEHGVAVLVPGPGFGGRSLAPEARGTGRGSDAKAIARWDVVPHQTFTGKLPIGVVAFHMAGIDRVEFSVNGGAWTAVREMTKNPATNVWEYVAELDAAAIPCCECEVRAVVWPKAGLPRVLAGPDDLSEAASVRGERSLFLVADPKGDMPSPERFVAPGGSDRRGDGSQTRPFATIGRAVSDVQDACGIADGATIRLAEGDYVYPRLHETPVTTRRWLTLAAAPGAAREKVRIVRDEGGRGLATSLVHLKGLTVRGVEMNDGGGGARKAWAEDCVLEGKDPLDKTRFFPLGQWTGGVYVTGCLIRNVKFPAYGHVLTRGTVITDCGGDAFREPAGLIASCEIKRLVNLDDTHNDVIQFWDPQPRSHFENVIVYGLKAVEDITAQALFVQQYGLGVKYDDFAFVNYLTYAPYGAQWQNPGTHLLLWNCSFLSPPAAIALNKGGLMFCDVTSGPARPTNVHDLDVRGCVFQRFNALQTGAEPDAKDASWAADNHFIDVKSFGSCAPGAAATTGGDMSSLFRDHAHGDFSPGGLIAGRCKAPLVPCDVDGRERTAPDAVGAVAGAR